MYFDADGLTAGSGEVAIGNVKRLLLDLEVYYAEGLGLGTERVAELSAEGLASDKNPGQVRRAVRPRLQLTAHAYSRVRATLTRYACL